MTAVLDTKTISAPFPNAKEFARVIYNYADDGGATGALDLITAGSDILITDFVGVVKTALAGSSMTLDVGKTGATTAIINGQAVTAMDAEDDLVSIVATNAAVLPLPLFVASGQKLIMTIADAALTAGKIEFIVGYMKP